MLKVTLGQELIGLVPMPGFQEVAYDVVDYLLVGMQLRIGTCEQGFLVGSGDDSLLGRDHNGVRQRREQA